MITETIDGTYLVAKPGPVPFGKTQSNHSVAVYRYSFGLVCDIDGSYRDRTSLECSHIKAVREFINKEL